MLTKEAISFAELGQVFRGLAVNFADEAVTDEETLGEIRSVYEKRLRGRITRMSDVTLDDDGNFKGRFEQYVNPRLTKRFSFIFGSDEVQFKALNADDIERFSEGVEDFAKSKRDAKNFKCKVAPCGGRCLKGGEACRQTMTPEEKRSHDKALRNKGRVDTSLAKKRREMKAGREKAAKDTKDKAIREREAKDKAILDKATKEADKLKNTGVDFKVDRSDHVALTKLGQKFSPEFKSAEPSAREKKLFDEKMVLSKRLMKAKMSGDSDSKVGTIATQFLRKERLYFAEVEKSEREDLKQFAGFKQKIEEKHDITPERIKEITNSVQTSSLDEKHKASVEKNLKEFCALTGGKGFESLRYISDEDERAYANKNGAIDVSKTPNKTTTLHELGHHVEYESESIRKSAVAFRESRATSLEAVPLKGLVPGSKYDEYEVATPGNYIHPYVGKVYRNGTTEVIAMGIQNFASPREMRELYKRDKDYFHYIVGVLVGED